MINIKMQPTEVQKLSPKIIVIGVGGAGGNAVNNMITSNLEGVEYVVCNTDAQALEKSQSPHKVQLGPNVTQGLGAGSKPEVGQTAAEESLEDVLQYVDGANMAFITAGMGGGTGTGAAPVIAKACRERGVLTVGVVTKPFHFEGNQRMKAAETGIEDMQGYVDTLIVIPNQNLFRVANQDTSFAEAFRMADSVLQSGVRGVTDLMVRPGLVNLDFADVRTAMMEMGKAMMGTGEAEGDKRAIEAAEAAINNPLLDDVSMKGAHGVIINVTGGYDMTLFEADEACNRIRDEVDPDANIIFGATFDDNLEGVMRVSIVATGIEKEAERKNISGSAGVKTEASGKATLERAKPNTSAGSNSGSGGAPQQQQPDKTPSQTASYAPLASKPKPFAPPPAPRAASGEPAPVQSHGETEAEIYEQAEFSASQEGQNSSAVPSNTALRGTRYKDSFIPPKPVESAAQTVPEREVGAQQEEQQPRSFHGGGSSAPSSSQASQAGTSSGLKLNPPKLPNPDEAKKRSPSLFERITGTVQHHIEGMMEDQSAPPKRRGASPPPLQSSGNEQQGGQAPQKPSQGSLNIDAPSKSGSDDDGQLDIPAFLRRQAN